MPNRLLRLVTALATIALVAAATVSAVTAVAAERLTSVEITLPDLPDLRDAAARDRSTATVVVASDGSEIGRFRPAEVHLPIDADAIPPNVELAILAAEDAHFYDHRGFDAAAMMRALLANVRNEGIVQGGSTITQQLVKNLFTGSDQTVERKVDELLAAVRLEQEHTKEEILAAYLNTVYFGEMAYGIEAAARTYFRKQAGDLTLSEAALLAGIIPSPSRWNPREDPGTADSKRREVLQRMVDTGMVPAHVVAEEMDRPPEVVPPRQPVSDHPYFLDYVRRWLIDVRGYDPDLLFQGGLRVETTLDPGLQVAARDAVEHHLPSPGDPAAAIAVVEPASGAVRALVGGRNWEESEVNFALGPLGGGSGRQPGSSMKAFVLAAAYEHGLSPQDIVPAPEKYVPLGSDEAVENYSLRGYGEVPLEEAIRRSINTSFVALTEMLSAATVAETASRLGISTLPDPGVVGVSIGIGAYEVSPLDMAAAYGAFARDGLRVEPRPVARVIGPEGEVIDDLTGPAPDQRALSEEAARLVTASLRRVISDGTGTRAAIGRPAAGKTGTTDGYTNAWFVGYTPELATAVWVGFPGGNIALRNIAGVARVTGGSIPAAIWRDVMSAAHVGRPVVDFPPPPMRAPTQTTTTTSVDDRPVPEDSAVEATTSASTEPEPVAPTTDAPPRRPSTTTTTRPQPAPTATTTTTTGPEATATTTEPEATTTTTSEPEATTTTTAPEATTTEPEPTSSTQPEPTSTTEPESTSSTQPEPTTTTTAPPPAEPTTTTSEPTTTTTTTTAPTSAPAEEPGGCGGCAG